MYVGIDAHQRDGRATVLNDTGETVSTARFPTNPKALTQRAERLPKGSVLALEASTVAKRIYWHLKEMDLDVRMAHPLEVRRRAGNKKKTDALDFFELADLLRMKRLPEAYVPSPEANERRQVLRYRIDLGKKARLVQNHIPALLVHHGVAVELSDTFGVEGRSRLDRMKLPSSQRYLLDGRLAQLDLLGRQIEEVEGQLAELGSTDPAVPKLMTLPGIDFYSAQVLLEEIGDITRFPTEKQLSSYAGLAPRVMQSGTTWRMGHIQKQGPKALRWILTTCADSAVKSPGKFQRLFRRGETRHGKGKAIVAVAHQMIEGICALLSRGESYSEERAESTRRKLPRMKGPARPHPAPELARRVGSLPNMATAILRGGRG